MRGLCPRNWGEGLVSVRNCSLILRVDFGGKDSVLETGVRVKSE